MNNSNQKELDFKNRVLELMAELLKNHDPKTAIETAIKIIAEGTKADEQTARMVVLIVMMEGLASVGKKYGYI
jgi:Zn-dependent M16 (insulinase) family peptidase